ncbi:MAG: hypothetical protein ACKVOU_03635 [Cytophagales bacterium]
MEFKIISEKTKEEFCTSLQNEYKAGFFTKNELIISIDSDSGDYIYSILIYRPF